MNKIRAASVLLLMLCLLGSLRAEIGNSITNFSLTGIDGKTYTPADYQDKVLILFFMGHS